MTAKYLPKILSAEKDIKNALNGKPHRAELETTSLVAAHVYSVVERGKKTVILPYHNFPYSVTAAEEALRIADACKREDDITVDRKALANAALFMHAVYTRKLEGQLFKDRAHYVSEIASDILNDKDVAKVLLGVSQEQPPESSQMLRAADLVGLSSGYPSFSELYAKMWEEHNLLAELDEKEPMKFREWRAMTNTYLRNYIARGKKSPLRALIPIYNAVEANLEHVMEHGAQPF